MSAAGSRGDVCVSQIERAAVTEEVIQIVCREQQSKDSWYCKVARRHSISLRSFALEALIPVPPSTRYPPAGTTSFASRTFSFTTVSKIPSWRVLYAAVANAFTDVVSSATPRSGTVSASREIHYSGNPHQLRGTCKSGRAPLLNRQRQIRIRKRQHFIVKLTD